MPTNINIYFRARSTYKNQLPGSALHYTVELIQDTRTEVVDFTHSTIMTITQLQTDTSGKWETDRKMKLAVAFSSSEFKP